MFLFMSWDGYVILGRWCCGASNVQSLSETQVWTPNLNIWIQDENQTTWQGGKVLMKVGQQSRCTCQSNSKRTFSGCNIHLWHPDSDLHIISALGLWPACTGREPLVFRLLVPIWRAATPAEASRGTDTTLIQQDGQLDNSKKIHENLILVDSLDHSQLATPLPDAKVVAALLLRASTGPFKSSPFGSSNLPIRDPYANPIAKNRMPLGPSGISKGGQQLGTGLTCWTSRLQGLDIQFLLKQMVFKHPSLKHHWNYIHGILPKRSQDSKISGVHKGWSEKFQGFWLLSGVQELAPRQHRF